MRFAPVRPRVGQFGDKFRKAREAKKISLDDASNVTKISARMLQAIEEEKFDLLPGGVFNKGFIRAYAKHLGINDEEAVTEYLGCLRRAQIEAQAAWEPPKRAVAPAKRPFVAPTRRDEKARSPAQVEELPELQMPREEHVRPPRQKYLAGNDGGISWRLWAVVAVVMALAFVLWRRHSRADVEDAASRAPAPVTQTVPAAESASAPTPGPAPASEPAPANSRSAVRSGTAGSAATHAPAPGKATSPAPQPVDGAGSDDRSAAAESAKPAPGDENNVPARAVETPPIAAAASLTLVIRATENSWISVSADGKTVNQETLIAPAHASVRASREIVAKVGNAAGVTFLWNGKEIPAQGEEAEVKTFVFDAVGMRVIATGQAPTQNQ
jgi:cytoskeleton protein RodZ